MTICVECKPDLILTQEIKSNDDNNIIHCGDKSRVIKRLNEQYTNSNGMIDEDPEASRPTSIKRLKFKKNYYNGRLALLYDEERNNHIIILRPRLEAWVLRIARLSGINVADYGLPNDEANLRKVINLRLDAFRRLIRDLYKVSPYVQLLGDLLSQQ